MGDYTVPPKLEALSGARAFVEGVASGLGLDRQHSYNLKLCVSEACANAVEHVPGQSGDIKITSWLEGEVLIFEIVSQGEFRVGSQRDPEKRAHRGLGLPLMISLMDEVQITRLETGETAIRLTLEDVSQKREQF